MKLESKIYVAGHKGLVGSAVLRKLKSEGYTNLTVKTHSELNLQDPEKVKTFFESEKPEYVFLAAAKVGGIQANNIYPVEFLLHNLEIQNNVMSNSLSSGVLKLLFLGSSCVYPKFPTLPITEDQLLTGALEPTNDAYAIAKIAGIKLCQSYNKQYNTNFISVMPTNVFGPNDNYDLETSHVLAALVRKIVDAKMTGTKQITVWGTGLPRREFIYSDDLAAACIFLMNNYKSSEIINIGVGHEISIQDLAKKIMKITGINLEISHDSSKPDGTLSKIMDSTKLTNLGWKPNLTLDQGLEFVINEYSNSVTKITQQTQ